MAQQASEAVFHVLGHCTHLRGRDVIRGHGLHAFEQSHVLGQLLLAMPALQVGQRIAGELLLLALQIGVAIEPPVKQIITVVVNHFDGAATAQTY